MCMVVRGFTSNTSGCLKCIFVFVMGLYFRSKFYQSPKRRERDKKKKESGAVYLSQFPYASYISIFMILYANNHSQKRGVILGSFS